MSLSPSGYEVILHGPDFFEIIFRDFKRETLDAWVAGADQNYPQLRELPRIRTLYDLSAIFAFTPSAGRAFTNVLYREYKASDLRVAFLVNNSLLKAFLEFHIHRQRERVKGMARVFMKRDEAMAWRRE